MKQCSNLNCPNLPHLFFRAHGRHVLQARRGGGWVRKKDRRRGSALFRRRSPLICHNLSRLFFNASYFSHLSSPFSVSFPLLIPGQRSTLPSSSLPTTPSLARLESHLFLDFLSRLLPAISVQRSSWPLTALHWCRELGWCGAGRAVKAGMPAAPILAVCNYMGASRLPPSREAPLAAM